MSNIISSAIVAKIKQGIKEHFDAALDKWLYQQGWPADLPITEADREAAHHERQQEWQERVKQTTEQERLDRDVRRQKQKEEIDRLVKEDTDRLEQERSPDYQGLSREDYQAVMNFYDDDERDHRHREAETRDRVKAGEFNWRKPNGETEDDPNDDPSRDEPEKQTDRKQTRLTEPLGLCQEPKRFRTRAQSQELPPPSYLVEGLIQEGSDCVLYADKQSLKSFIALDIGLSVATGTKALESFSVKRPGIVFYFAGEGRDNLERKRATAWEISHGFQPFSVENIYIGSGATMTSDTYVDSAIRDMLEIIGDRLGKVPVLFVIDTLSRALNGQDEDKAHVSAQYLNRIQTMRNRIGGTSLTIAHTGKDKGRGIRGSGGYGAGFDTILTVDNVSRDDETHLHTIDLLVEKQKDDEDGQRYFFQSEKILTPSGDSLVLHPLDEETARSNIRGKKPLSEADVISAIKELTKDTRSHTTTKRAIAKLLAEPLGITIDGVERALDRKYRNFCVDGKWRLPGYMNGADESLADQLAAFKISDSNSIFQ
jgi:AAA domain